MKSEPNESGHPSDENDTNLPGEAGSDKHLDGFSNEDKKMIQLMADIVVQSVLNS